MAGALRFILSADEAPATPGAYVLWLRLATPVAAAAGPREALLEAGDYLYCGSAHGPGGLRARLARHMRREKKPHWHIDQLTVSAEIVGAFFSRTASECGLNEALGALPAPLPGFGAADCPHCASHLRFFPASARLPSAWENARRRRIASALTPPDPLRGPPSP